MMLRDSILHIDPKMDSVYITKMIRVSLFGDHLAAYAEYVYHVHVYTRFYHNLPHYWADVLVDTNSKISQASVIQLSLITMLQLTFRRSLVELCKLTLIVLYGMLY